MQSQSVTPGDHHDHHFAFHDTREHKLTCCSKYDSIRGSFSALFPEWETYPKCFQMHGIVPDKPWLLLVWEAHESATIQVDGFPVQRNGNYAALLHRWNGCRSLQPTQKSLLLHGPSRTLYKDHYPGDLCRVYNRRCHERKHLQYSASCIGSSLLKARCIFGSTIRELLTTCVTF